MTEVQDRVQARVYSHASAARAAKLARAQALGIDEAFIALMVDRFYARVRSDPLLGPVFDARIADWPAHLARMQDFWGAVLRGGGGFSGNPRLKHIAIPGIDRPEFERWLALFRDVLEEIARDPAAPELIHASARTIAESLLQGIHIHRDGHLPSSEEGRLHA